VDIVALIKAVVGESATAALALFAIWSLKKLYEQRLQERTDYAAQRLQEREDYAKRLETINETLIVKLGEVSHALGANTQVLERLLAER